MKSQKYKSIKELLEITNPKFYNWLNKILKCNVSRTIPLCTYLLNFNLSKNYFPWFDTLYREIPNLISPEIKDKFIGFTYISEFIFGIILLITLSYKSQKRKNSEETDKLINKLWLSGPLVFRFVSLNSLSSDYYKMKTDKFLALLSDFIMQDKMLPRLEFYPEFQKILENDAIKELYDTSFITNWLKSKEPKPQKYLPDKKIFFENLQFMRDNKKKLFEVDSTLTISKLTYSKFNIFPQAFFSCTSQINEIINLFKNFYSTKIVSKKNEISDILLCFGELLNLLEGKLYKKFRFNTLIKKLNKTIPKEKMINFLKRFTLSRNNFKDLGIYNDFKPNQFLSEYSNFLSYALYELPGSVYTGVFLIWRTMIKYLETLQNLDEFKLKKERY